MQFQIHLAGTKRSGKTTVAQGLVSDLERIGCQPVILDVDAVRRALFFQLDEQAKTGSPENKLIHQCALEVMFHHALPTILQVGGTPIIVTTHSRRHWYDVARACAGRHNVPFRFMMLESPSYEEVKRRAVSDASSMSDARDFDDPAIVEAYWTSRRTLEEEYSGIRDASILFVPQGTLGQMAHMAFEYVLKG